MAPFFNGLLTGHNGLVGSIYPNPKGGRCKGLIPKTWKNLPVGGQNDPSVAGFLCWDCPLTGFPRQPQTPLSNQYLSETLARCYFQGENKGVR